jgi:ABC-type dipeptide/oligopeptide/nickel transport system ATPase component
MKSGTIVECAPTQEIFSSPAHEYTRALVWSLPKIPLWLNESGARSTERLEPVESFR